MLGETWKDHHERLKRSHALVQQVGGRTLLPHRPAITRTTSVATPCISATGLPPLWQNRLTTHMLPQGKAKHHPGDQRPDHG